MIQFNSVLEKNERELLLIEDVIYIQALYTSLFYPIFFITIKIMALKIILIYGIN